MADMYPDDFYLTKRWEQMRLKILRRDRYECQWSKRYKAVPDQAECVHHIFPLEYFPEYKWEPWNLISLSMQAHNRMHDRETHELTREGYELLYRTARKQKIENVDELLMSRGIKVPRPVRNFFRGPLA